MSTRSGKRLHSTFHENALKSDAELVHKTIRKARPKRLKENEIELDTTLPKSKIRTNYVSYPTDDELVGHPAVTDLAVVNLAVVKHSRKTLRDRNAASEGITEDSGLKKVVRQTRSSRKLPVKFEDVIENAENIAVEVVTKVKSKIKKSRKKKSKSFEPQNDSDTDVEATTVRANKLRKKKKGKQSNSIISTNIPSIETNTDILKSTGTEDSFHSAAGSPLKDSDMLIKEHNITTSQEQIITNFSTTLERNGHTEGPTVLNGTFDKQTKASRKSSLRNSTIDQIEISGRLSNGCHSTPEINYVERPDKSNATFEKDHHLRESTSAIPLKETSEILNDTYNKPSKHDSKPVSAVSAEKRNGTFEKSHRNSITAVSKSATPEILNSTYEKTSKNNSKLNSTYDKNMDTNNLDNTFSKLSRKTSLISSSSTINVTFDKSNTNSQMNISSDESRTVNIVNTTPVLIESSMDVSQMSEVSDRTSNNHSDPAKNTNNSFPNSTSLIREGTFTKDSPDIIMSPKSKTSEKTPTKRVTLFSAGCTPFHVTHSSRKGQNILNATRSLEKSSRRSMLPEVAPRLTKVMFCSPVNSPTLVMQKKRTVIKSSLKGSNKSFVFDESVPSNSARAPARKRSFTHSDADDSRAKRKRLGDELQQSMDRLSRPRTSSATVKPTDQTTPAVKPISPNKARSDRPSRTRLPNFAALHQKRFERMESLDECQQRRARRARQLLTPTGGVAVLQRSSPRGITTEPPKPSKETKTPKEIPKPLATAKESSKKPTAKPLPTLDTLATGYTRFGFKLNIGVNPFSVPSSSKPKPKEIQPNGLVRQLSQPSLSGMTRREAAKEAVMRGRTRTSSSKRSVKRTENLTIIKGVRTNRRFELQMKMRGDIN